jgi:hypothetical protein
MLTARARRGSHAAAVLDPDPHARPHLVFVHGVWLAMHYGMRSVAPLRALVSV